MPNDNDVPIDKFELGLVLAGTVSAGAYTAGAIDFLIEALDAWEAAKESGEGPDHKLELKTITGASGGAMNAAIAAAALHAEIEHYKPKSVTPAPKKNRFFNSWVKRIDISYLLQKRDLEKHEKVLSLLDSTELDVIAAEALDVDPAQRERNYLADHIDIYLTITNTRGVDYRFDLSGGETDSASRFGHPMRTHADYMHFSAGRTPPAREVIPEPVAPEPIWLDVNAIGRPDINQSDNWQTLITSALASGAFPVGLRARKITRKRADYARRKWAIPTEESVSTGSRKCTESREIPPLWSDPVEPNYQFVNVDGGTINNEPLELARLALAGPDGRNSRHPLKVKRAVVMIDPLVRQSPAKEADYQATDDLISVAGTLIGMFKNQARFKADELVLAQSESVFSRFLLAPRRVEDDGRYRAYPIFGEMFGAFAGFLDEEFRRHDFELGRRNCQRFLARYFALPENHSLFRNWSKDQRGRYAVRDTTGNPIVWPAAGAGTPVIPPQRLLPIVPLVAAVASTVPIPFRPDWQKVKIDKISRKIGGRVGDVLSRLIDTDLRSSLGWLVRKLAKTYISWFGEKVIAKKVESMLRKDLAKLDEMH